ncbi:hypothetical protein CHI08_04970 [Peribacillus simplex]|nr:hypothetical protein CHI08_04970 [Peribacillus simplex]
MAFCKEIAGPKLVQLTWVLGYQVPIALQKRKEIIMRQRVIMAKVITHHLNQFNISNAITGLGNNKSRKWGIR